MNNLKKAVSITLALLMFFTAFPLQNLVYADLEQQGKYVVITVTDENNEAVDLSEYSADDIFRDLCGSNYTISGNTIISNLPDYTTSTFTYTCLINGVEGYQNNGSASYHGSLTLNNDGYAEASLTLTNLKDTTISANPCSFKYGDDPISLMGYVSFTEGYDGISKTSYTITSGNDVISLSGNMITAKKSGSAVVHVLAPATNNFKAAETDINITVSEKELVITQEDINNGHFNASKIYDGTLSVPVTGVFYAGEEISYSATATIDNPNAGWHYGILSDLKLTEHTDMYTAIFDGGLSIDNVHVEKLPIDVVVDDIELSYGSLDWRYIKDEDYSSFFTKEMVASLVSASTDIPDNIKAEAIDSMLNSISINIDAEKLKNTNYAVGTYDAAIEVTFDEIKSGNFSFSTVSNPCITITTEITDDDEALWNRIEIDEKSAVGAYVSGKTTYLSKDGYVTYKIKDSERDKYDSVAIRITDSYSNKVTGNESGGALSGTFYLYNSSNPDTRTDASSEISGMQDNNIPKGVLFVDNDAPLVHYNDEDITNLTDETISDLSFSEIVLDKLPSIKGKCEDETSGIKSASFAVIKADDLDKSLMEIAKDTKMAAWNSGDTFDLSGIKEDGYYVLITKATDNTDNVSCQAYGILKDTNSPSLTVSGIDNNGIYNKDVNYTLNISDMADAVSGLSKISIEVTVDGKKATSTKAYTNSYTINQEEIDALIGTTNTNPAEKEVLGKTLTINGYIAKELNSSNIDIKISAIDRAGNSIESNYTINIDTDAPKINVSYDNNSVKNETFFKNTRTATVKVSERSYNEDSVVFTIGVDGLKNEYSLTELKGEQVPSVKFVDETKKDDVYTYRLIFGNAGEDHTYNLDVSLEDMAGNKSESIVYENGTKAGDFFTVDMVPIKAEVTFKDENGSTLSVSDVVTYCNKKVNASIYLKENNYDASEATAIIKQIDVKGNTVAAYDVSAFLKVIKDTSLENEKIDGNYTFPVFDKDANYTISLSVSDKAGNVTEINGLKLTIDRTAPIGSIYVKTDETDGTYTGTSKTAKPWHISNTEATVDAAYEDATSGVAKVEYYLYTPSEDAAGTFNIPDITALPDKVWKEWPGQLSLNTEGQSVVYLKITDMAGNICYINANDETIIDKTAPSSPQIALNIGNEDTIHSSNVPFTISVTDSISGGTYSGLKSVICEVLKDGAITQSNTYSFNDRTQRVKSAGYSDTVIAEKNNSNHVTIRVTSVDYAGNTSTAEKSLKIDITAPRIEISYDSTTDNGYYNNTRTATVSVYERNFNPSAFKLDIQNILGNNAKVGSWSLAQNMGESDDALSTLKVVFDKDDDYTVTASITDVAGNSSSLGRTDKFTIDKTIPVVSIDFDNNSPSNGKYYNAARTATITVTERNFDASKFAIDVAASLEGQAITSPTISGWSGSGETHTATIIFNADGDYSFSCTAGDMAGNVSDKISIGEFTLDFVKPVITIDGVTDQSAYNGELSPVISYTDINIGDASSATITLKGARHEEKTITGSAEEIANGWRVFLSDIEKSRDTDDVYALTVTATDLAGNTETKALTFSINRFGSNFTFDDATETILDNFYLKNKENLVVYETNVNDIVHHSITLGLNGVTTILKEGADYSVKKDKTEGWTVYTYTISKNNFNEEGVYEIVITSTDSAGNTQNNQLKEVPITLAIDKTAPAVVISGVKDGESYNATKKEVTFTVSDNLAIGTLDIYLNGKLTKSFTAKEFSDANGVATITVNETNGYQEIYATASDAAGNETVSDTYRFLISSNAFIRFINNKPLFIGVIAAIIAAIAALLLIIWKKRHDDDEEKKEGKATTEELDTKPKGDEETEEITR